MTVFFSGNGIIQLLVIDNRHANYAVASLGVLKAAASELVYPERWHATFDAPFSFTGGRMSACLIFLSTMVREPRSRLSLLHHLQFEQPITNRSGFWENASTSLIELTFFDKIA